MTTQTEVLVLSQQDYRENDSLLKVITKDKGLLTFVAKGLNKINSKNRMGALPYGKSLFFYDEKEGKDLQSLQQAQSIVNRYKIHEDLEKSTCASFLVEISDAILKHEQDFDILAETYDFIDELLNLIETTNQYSHIIVITLIHFLDLFGLRPYVDACVSCGSTQINSISIEEGGFICHNCQHELQSPIYDVQSLKSFRLMGHIKPEHIDAYLKMEAPSLKMIQLLVQFFEYHASQHLNSWEFIQKWTIIK